MKILSLFVWMILWVFIYMYVIYDQRLQIAEDFIGYALAAVIAIVVFVVKKIKSKGSVRAALAAQKIESYYVPLFAFLWGAMIFISIAFFLFLIFKSLL